MRHWVVAVSLCPALMGGQAYGISCLLPSAQELFRAHQDSSNIYLMAVGTIAPVNPMPQFNSQTLQFEPSGRFAATFSGKVARPRGFDLRATLDITVQMNCFDDVCGFLPLKQPAVVFLQQTQDGYVLDTDYCTSTLLEAPTQSDLDQLIDCLNGETCADLQP